MPIVQVTAESSVLSETIE